MDDDEIPNDVYLSISFQKLSPGLADKILRVVAMAAGLVSYNIYITDARDEED